MRCEVEGGGWKLHGVGGLLPTLFIKPIVPEQKQDDQKGAAQVGFCFMLGRGST